MREGGGFFTSLVSYHYPQFLGSNKRAITLRGKSYGFGHTMVAFAATLSRAITDSNIDAISTINIVGIVGIDVNINIIHRIIALCWSRSMYVLIFEQDGKKTIRRI